MKNEAKYFAYGNELTRFMNGDRAEDRNEHSESDDLNPFGSGCFDSKGDAIAAALAYLEENRNAINYQKHGIGSVTHWAIEVYRMAWDEEFEEWAPCDEDGCVSSACEDLNDALVLYVDSLDGSTEEAAWNKAVRSYYAFLDYEEDGYETVSECMA